MPEEERFKIPKTVDIPVHRRVANITNARWILRNIFLHNPPDVALVAKAAANDWVARWYDRKP